MTSRIYHDMAAQLQKFSAKDGDLEAVFSFAAGFSGFQGHFPASPVLPGICQVQSVLAVISKASGTRLKLIGLSQAKFLNPVFPGEEILVKGRINWVEDCGEACFQISKTGQNVSRIRLSVMKKEENA